jgi:hypothetical protein
VNPRPEKTKPAKITWRKTTPKELDKSGVVFDFGDNAWGDFADVGDQYLILLDGKPVGWFQLGDKGLHVIEVRPEYQKRGIATRILKELFDDSDFDAGTITTPEGLKLVQKFPNAYYQVDLVPEKNVKTAGAKDTRPICDETGKIVAINPDLLSNQECGRISEYMVLHGYDSRGGQDARRALKRFWDLHNRPPELSESKEPYILYKANPHWAESIARVLGMEAFGRPVKVGPNDLRKIIRTLGLTEDFRECGYILTNGKMLDLSGKNQGGWPGRRSLDHRQLPSPYNESEGMERFMAAGHIRVFPATNGASFDIRREPTPAQYLTIARFCQWSTAGGCLDLRGNLGKFNKCYDHLNERDDYRGGFKLVFQIRAFYSRDTNAKAAKDTANWLRTAQGQKPHWFNSVIAEARIGDSSYVEDGWLLKTEGWGNECFEGEDLTEEEGSARSEDQSQQVIEAWQSGYELPEGNWVFQDAGYLRYNGSCKYGVTWALFAEELLNAAEAETPDTLRTAATNPNGGLKKMKADINDAYRELVARFSTNDLYQGNLDGACLEASVLFVDLLRKRQIQAELVRYLMSDSSGHWAVKTPAGVYDPTINWWPETKRNAAKKLHSVGPNSPHHKWEKDPKPNESDAREIFRNDFEPYNKKHMAGNWYQSSLRKEAGSNPPSMTSDEMAQWLEDNRSRNAFGAMSHDDIKQIANYSDKWELQSLNPKSLGDWVLKPRKKRNQQPIVVGLAGGEYDVLDGRHRVGEANWLGASQIQAYVGQFFGETEAMEKKAGTAKTPTLAPEIDERNKFQANYLGKDDKFWGIEQNEDFGYSVFRGTEFSGTECTGYACRLRQKYGPRVKIYGFFEHENRASQIARHAGGHDFAVLDDRWIIDPWLDAVVKGDLMIDDWFQDFEHSPSLGGVFDLQNKEDARWIRKLYGKRENWRHNTDAEKIADTTPPHIL